MANLITLDTAKKHWKGDYDAEDLQRKLDQAEAFILNYIARSNDAAWTAEMAAWTDETVPGQVQAAILLQFQELNRFRGDDTAQDVPKREHGYPSPAIVATLYQSRDPVIA